MKILTVLFEDAAIS